jgi:TRAP-type C4-dicarboxylate transport system permease small subunit
MELSQVRPPINNVEVINEVATFKGLEWIFNNIVSVILGLAGVVLFLLLLMGGFKYITAGGDPKAVEGAKKTLTYAIIGFVVIASAFLVLRFIQEFTGAQVGNFNVTQ